MKARLFCLKSLFPVTLAGVFIWKNFHPGYRDLGNLTSPASHMKGSVAEQDLANRASPVNRAYMKRPYLFLIIITNDRVEVEVVVEVLRVLGLF